MRNEERTQINDRSFFFHFHGSFITEQIPDLLLPKGAFHPWWSSGLFTCWITILVSKERKGLIHALNTWLARKGVTAAGDTHGLKRQRISIGEAGHENMRLVTCLKCAYRVRFSSVTFKRERCGC